MDYRSAEPLVALIIILLTIDISFVGPQQAVSSLKNMEQSAKEREEEECGICLDALTNPVALPCSHKFCSECLNGWKSKYGARDG